MDKKINIFNMVSSGNIVSIFFLIAYIGTIKSNDSINECISNIYRDFGYGEENQYYDDREVWPITGFLKLTENDFGPGDGLGYFGHIYSLLYPAEGMDLVLQYCYTQTQTLEGAIGLAEYRTCFRQLSTNFSTSENEIVVIKDAYQRLKDTNFMNLRYDGSLIPTEIITINLNGTTNRSDFSFINPDGTLNYSYMYFFYLSQKIQFNHTTGLPLTPREYCSFAQQIKEQERRKSNSSDTESSGSSKPIEKVYKTQDLIDHRFWYTGQHNN